MINKLTDANDRNYASIEIDADYKTVYLHIKDHMDEQLGIASMKQMKTWAEKIGALTIGFNIEDPTYSPSFISMKNLTDLISEYHIILISQDIEQLEELEGNLRDLDKKKVFLTSQVSRARAWMSSVL
jgi:hypothetical protein